MSDVEFLDQNRHRAYPFVESPTFDSPNDDYDVDALFLDAVVVFQAPAASSAVDDHWRIRSLDTSDMSLTMRNFATSSDVNLGVPLFDSSMAGSVRVMQWVSESDQLVVTLVMDGDHSALSSGSTLTFGNPPEFAPRCLERQALRVDSVSVRAGDVPIDLGDTIRISEGSNIDLRVNPDTPLIAVRRLRRTQRPQPNRVLLAAVPGAGDGRIDTGACAPDGSAIFTINRISGRNGSFVLSGDSCYRLQRTEDATVREAALTISNDCVACCHCAEFVELLEQIRDAKNRGLAVKAIWDSVRAEYESLLETWNEFLTCTAVCVPRLKVLSYTGWLVTVQVWIGNYRGCMQPGASAVVTFGGGDYSPEYVPGTGLAYSAQDSFVESDPTVNPDGSFTMEDNSGIQGGGFKILTMSVRMARTGDRIDGNAVQVSVALSACDSVYDLSGLAILKSNQVRD